MKKLLFACALITISSSFNAQNYYVSTVAGNGTQGLVDGAAVTTAELYDPYGVAYDGDSVIFFCDGGNHSVRKLSLNTHIVTTIAGNGTAGLQDGIGAAAKFNWPDGIVYKNGFLYIGDNINNCIRQIDLSTKMVTTIAGTGVAGYLDGPAAQAQFTGGLGITVAVANNGDIFVADGGNAVIRKISNGQVTTIAGTPGVFGYVDGSAASSKFHRPRYMALDTTNNDLYITDINNNVVRKLSGGLVSTFSGTGVAGGTDGSATTATFSAPVGIAITFGKHFYVVDGGGNKLRKMDSTGTVTTIAGNGVFGFQDGPAANAEFNYPQGVCYDKHCYIYMADKINNRIRSIVIPEGPAGCLNASVNNFLPKELNIKVFPNPASNNLTIEIGNFEGKNTYKIIDLIGHSVKSGSLNTSSVNLDLQGMVSGIYTLEIVQENKSGNITHVSKINVQR